ncbi:right-handed parallel beta-helix repeat-containing protein [Tautonia marina]|uniref:right-handed parallel beta-helix repeat-containing protein n=1 Tax=Tautonia marina TaxID=2653855 RepID=UPI0012605F1E|nr:right-handed parallel beta-helix repeat-containing protein [Tautonia marina]
MASVRDYGAVGDGQSDDTEALRHAVEAGDGSLEFDRGTYRISGTVDIPLDTHGAHAIRGDGTARIVMTAAGPAFRIVGTHRGTADPGSLTESVANRERLPTVSGIEIVGEHDGAVGIELTGTMEATLHAVLIRQCLIGVHLTNRNRNVLINACHIYHGRGPRAIGVFFDAVNLHQAIIVGSHISYHRHAGIKIARSEIRNLHITGNDIEYNHDDQDNSPDSADVWIDSREGTVREGTIASNTIQAKPSPNGSNVRIEGPERDDSAGAGLWTIVGNILQSQERNLWLRFCRAVTVSGNSFASASRHSIDIDACRIISLGSNTIDHNPDYRGSFLDGIVIRRSSAINLNGMILEGVRVGRPDRGAAIAVSDSEAITIAHCQVLDPTARAIELSNVRSTMVDGCTLLDRRSEPSMTEAIRLRGQCSGVAIRGNLVTGGQSAIIAEAGDAIVVEGNLSV